VTAIGHRCNSPRLLGRVLTGREFCLCATTSLPNKTLQQTAATGIALPGLEVTEVAAAAELGRSAYKHRTVRSMTSPYEHPWSLLLSTD
jgi:hypothetical protein